MKKVKVTPHQLLSFSVLILQLSVATWAFVQTQTSLVLYILNGLFTGALVGLALRTITIDPSGLPYIVFDEHTVISGQQFYCKSCEAYVKPDVKHCENCKRCIVDFDHHCKWLNTCISGKNYRLFIGLIMLLELTSSLTIAFFGSLLAVEALTWDEAVLYLSSWSFIVIYSGILLANTGLIGLHIYLHTHHLSTYEFLVSRRNKVDEEYTDRPDNKLEELDNENAPTQPKSEMPNHNNKLGSS